MLRYAAEDFHEISATLMKFTLFPALVNSKDQAPFLRNAFQKLYTHCSALGLQFSMNQAQLITQTIKGGKARINQLPSMFEQLHRRIHEELEVNLFRHIPKDRNKFVDPSWLTDSPIHGRFPSAFEEFQA